MQVIEGDNDSNDSRLRIFSSFRQTFWQVPVICCSATLRPIALIQLQAIIQNCNKNRMQMIRRDLVLLGEKYNCREIACLKWKQETLLRWTSKRYHVISTEKCLTFFFAKASICYIITRRKVSHPRPLSRNSETRTMHGMLRVANKICGLIDLFSPVISSSTFSDFKSKFCNMLEDNMLYRTGL